MNNEWKPCPNCGSANLHQYPLSDMVECNDCCELRSTQEWQANSPREEALQAQVDALLDLARAALTPTEWSLESRADKNTTIDRAIAKCRDLGLEV